MRIDSDSETANYPKTIKNFSGTFFWVSEKVR